MPPYNYCLHDAGVVPVAGYLLMLLAVNIAANLLIPEVVVV
jgi:hypothetical protein